MKNHKTILFALLLISCGAKHEMTKVSPSKKSEVQEALLIGTFHYNNPGADVVKTKSFDILDESAQLELEKLSNDIAAYNPSKIFVEWPYNEQKDLDSLYQLYLKGEYFDNDSLSNYYQKNEIFQLAFRVAKKNNLEKVFGIDYNDTEFPFGKVMSDIEANSQIKLKDKIESSIAKITTDFDNMIDSGTSLTELTLALNTKEMRYTSNDLHNNTLSIAGSVNEFNGVYLTSEWYKRNLYMWALIQKHTSDDDKRIMILAGSSHIAMIELFIDQNIDWEVKELKEILYIE